MPDAAANWAYTTVATPPSPATSGTSIVITSATAFPIAPGAGQYNVTICPAGTQPNAANAEIVRVTATSGTTFTIVRAQEGTTARTIVAGDQFFVGLTAKVYNDVAPKGVSNSVQFYDGAQQQGAALTGVGTTGSLLVGVDGTNPLPPAGYSSVFSKNIAGRAMLAQNEPTGHDTTFQASFARNKVRHVSAIGNGVTGFTMIGYGAPGTAGSPSGVTPTATNAATRSGRVKYATTTTAPSYAELRAGGATFGCGTGVTSDGGGYFMNIRWVPSNGAAVSGERFFAGMTASTAAAATNVEPSTLVNTVGVAQLSTDATQWYLVYGGTTAQTPIALGTALGAPNTLGTTIWDLSIFAPPGVANSYTVRLENVSTGASVTQTVTGGAAVVPISTQFTGYKIYKTNNATAAISAFDFISHYIETDN